MRILLSHFLDDQYERVSKVLEDDPKAPMSTNDTKSSVTGFLESSADIGSASSGRSGTRGVGRSSSGRTRGEGGGNGEDGEDGEARAANCVKCVHGARDTNPKAVMGLDSPGDWPPPPISEPSVLSTEMRELHLEDSGDADELDLLDPPDEFRFNPFISENAQIPRLLQHVELDCPADERDETDSVSDTSVKTRSGVVLIDTFEDTRCLGLDHLFGKSVDVASYEDTTHLVDVLATMQKVLNVPMVAVSTMEGGGVYLKTPGGMFIEKNPVLGSFLDWILAIGYYHIAPEKDGAAWGAESAEGRRGGTQEELNNKIYNIQDENKTDAERTNEEEDPNDDIVWRVECTTDHPVFSKCLYCTHAPHVRYICTAPIYRKCGGNELIGHLHVMGRVPCNDKFMTAFASVMSQYVHSDTQGKRIDDDQCKGRDRDIEGLLHCMKAHRAQRLDMLEALFDDWHLPLEICHGDTVVYRNRQFTNLMSPTAAIASVPLFGYEFDGFDPTRSSVHLCSMLVLCLPNLDAHEDEGRYRMRYFEQEMSKERLDMLVRGIEGISDVNPAKPRTSWCSCCDMYKRYDCLYRGEPAFVEAIKYRVAHSEPMAMSPTSNQSWVHSKKETGKLFRHDNILKNCGSGFFGPEHCPLGNWIIQRTNLMPLSEAIRSHFNGVLKPLYVALSALDIAYGIQHVHNVGMVYEDLDSSRIFLQVDPKEAFRGWRLVLSPPDMLDAAITSGKSIEHKIYEMCPHRSRRSCPEKSLGCRVSLRTESFEYGVLIWEMWEGLPLWPQIDREEDLLNVICYEKHVLGCCSTMPMPLRSIFQRCVGTWGHPSISNETIITMLQDWLTKLLRRHQQSWMRSSTRPRHSRRAR